ncbi:hypothetical protein IL308_11035 [Lactococcus lactis]|uniref:hypothetical protein n=1 Tax=Lactococcus lactis TaxID=1358 RepID=UPI001913D266|nr:hypothetical protein [Lactococcus lactis]MBK5077288.1 hypothetical protein [Lactococcus lactis]WDA67388.1 hypothetical protein IL310_00945 [Lactococcus lactis]
MKITKIIGQTIIVVLLIIMVFFIGKVYMDNKENANIEKQRTAAIGFKKVQPGVEEIKFMQEGSYSGAGTWSVGVNTIVDGKKYSEIFREEGLMGGDELPEGNTGTKSSVKVIYSNGKEEILK